MNLEILYKFFYSIKILYNSIYNNLYILKFKNLK